MSRVPFWQRMAVASLAFVETYRESALSPAERASVLIAEQWDDYEARLFRYLHYDYYYANKAYSSLVKYAQLHKAKAQLYRYTRSIYNPVFRLVELHASKAFPGAIDWEKMETGAIPFDSLDDPHRTAIRQLWKWSNIGSLKTRYPRDLARFGDAVIKVVDDPFAERVRLELLHPGIVRDADISPQGVFKYVLIAYQREDLITGQPWTYEEEIVKDGDLITYSTFRDGRPWAEYQDELGRPITSWSVPYGFIPLVLVRALELGHAWGAAPFFGTIDKIDQLNDLASITYDQIRKSVNAVYYLEGVTTMNQVQETIVATDASDRDRVMFMLGPIGSKATPMVAPLDLMASLAAIKMQLEEIEQDHPELALYNFGGGERVTAPGTLSIADPGVQRITDFRNVADSGLLRAHQMGLSIGGWRGYDGFAGFNLESYARGDLDFEISERPVLRDTLTKRERIDALNASQAPKRWVWQELNKSEQEIKEAEDEIEERRQEQMQVQQDRFNDQKSEGNDGSKA